MAQFGRGVLAEVSAKLLGQFVDALEADLAGIGRRRRRTPGAGVRAPDDPGDAGTAATDRRTSDGGTASPAATRRRQPADADPWPSVEPVDPGPKRSRSTCCVASAGGSTG